MYLCIKNFEENSPNDQLSGYPDCHGHGTLGGHCELAHLSVLYVSLRTQNPFWYTQNMHSWFVCLFFGFLPSLFIINALDTFNFGSGC